MPNSKTATDQETTKTASPENDAKPVAEGGTEGVAVASATPETTPGSDALGGGIKKSPLGAKEIPPFEWKLLGTVNYATLTLFKSVERADSEAQMERVLRDGYYKDLKIVGVNDKVVQPKLPAAMRKKAAAKEKKATSAAAKSSKKSKKAARQSSTIKITLKKIDKKTAKKKTVKKAVKKAAKKVVKKSAKKTAKKAAPVKKKAAAKKATTKKTAKKAAPKKSVKKKAATKKTAAKKKTAKKKKKKK